MNQLPSAAEWVNHRVPLSDLSPTLPAWHSHSFSCCLTLPNTVVRRGRWLIAGNESGHVDVFDLGQNPSPLVSSADLPQLTGHTNSEDVEIRALWTDHHDNLIFAGSSWGNDRTRGPSLPSFFVLELLKD
jgi:hypothetical protein